MASDKRSQLLRKEAEDIVDRLETSRMSDTMTAIGMLVSEVRHLRADLSEYEENRKKE